MAQAPETDKLLVERVCKGDKRAFDLLVIKYQYKILGLVSSYIHDFQEVQDVTQEAFIKAYKAMGKFRGDSSFYTWLYRIAINTAKNHLVSRGRRPPSTDVDIHGDESHDHSYMLKDSETPERNLQKTQMEEAIFRVMRTLPDELRTAVTLREFDGLSYDQIAQVMDCPIGTVRSRIFRARETIDKVIRPLLSRAG
ncbi:MAG: RNA polymerase sigma factor RpoE [Kistimonas sp.]|nr:RNA polymerase sigma factor RpoE [Kistimonas sp.]